VVIGVLGFTPNPDLFASLPLFRSHLFAQFFHGPSGGFLANPALSFSLRTRVSLPAHVISEDSYNFNNCHLSCYSIPVCRLFPLPSFASLFAIGPFCCSFFSSDDDQWVESPVFTLFSQLLHSLLRQPLLRHGLPDSLSLLRCCVESRRSFPGFMQRLPFLFQLRSTFDTSIFSPLSTRPITPTFPEG